MGAGAGTRAAQVRGQGSFRTTMLTLAQEESERGFFIRFVIVAALLLLVPWAVSLADPPGMLRYLVPASGALILVVAYSRWPLEALYSLAMYVAFYDSIGLHIGGIKQIDELAVVVILPLAFLRARSDWRRWTSWPRDLLIGMAIAMGIVSSLVADVPTAVWLPALALAVKAILFFYVVLWSRFETWAVSGAMRVTVGIGVTVVALGLVEMLFPSAFQASFGLNEYRHFRGEFLVIKSLFSHPALFGFVSTFAALFAFAYYLTTRGRWWLVAGLFMSLGTFLSARRRAILALVLSLVAAAIATGRWVGGWRGGFRLWLPVAGGLLLMAAVFMSGLSDSFGRALVRYWFDSIANPPIAGDPEIGGSDNPQARVALYRASIEIAGDNFPFGAGLGRYGSWMSREHYSPVYYQYELSEIRGLWPARAATDDRRARVAAPSATDTFWPAILGEMGVIGLVGYLGFLAALGWMLWSEVGRDDSLELRTFRLAAGMVFAQAIVESAASSMFYSPPRVYLFYLVVGIVASLAWHRRASATE
jgi:hypothetical protein